MTKQKIPLSPPSEPLLIVISGPSGVGKDTVIDKMKERGLPFHFVVTATTRSPRPEETDGVDYIFLSNDQFAEMIENDELLEYAIVYNDYKGIPKSQVREALASGKDVIMRIDVQGAETVQSLENDALLVFLITETEQELENRLRKRHTETDKSLKLRIATARKEHERIDKFDYVVINEENQVEKTVDTIEAIIRAEHHRVEQRQVNL